MANAIVVHKTRVIDVDLRAYFDNIRHHQVLEKVARRVNDTQVLHLLKLILTATGKKGVAQGGVLSPVLSNLYLTEVDQMLERAKEVTRYGQYTALEYCRWADDLVVLVDAHPRHDRLVEAVPPKTPFGSKARAAICTATRTGSYNGSSKMPIPIRTRDVRAAIAASIVSVEGR